MTVPKDVEERFAKASERFTKAFDQLPDDRKAQVAKLIEQANLNTLTGLGHSTLEAAPVVSRANHELVLAATALQQKSLGEVIAGDEGLTESLEGEEEAEEDLEIEPPIGPGGEIWGWEKYQQLDPGWLESAAVWLENFDNKKEPFPSSPAAE